MLDWLCVGDKKRKIPKCKYARVELKKENDFGKRKTILFVVCDLEQKRISKVISKCENHAYENNNQKLTGYV